MSVLQVRCYGLHHMLVSWNGESVAWLGAVVDIVPHVFSLIVVF